MRVSRPLEAAVPCNLYESPELGKSGVVHW